MAQANAAMKTYHIQPAGFISRFIAFVIDLVIISLMMFLVIAGVNLITNFFNFDALIARALGEGSAIIDMLEHIIVLATTFAGLLLGVFYFLVFWTLAGFTPGKAVLGLRIVRPDREPITGARALLRFVGYWVSAIPLFLGYIWVLLDHHRQGWHDKMAGTYVVYVREIDDEV